MDKSSLRNFAQLKSLLIDMERSLGISALGEAERGILAAAAECADHNDIVKTGDIFEHKCAAHLSRPTFFRAVKRLVELGHLNHAPHEKSGYYQLNLTASNTDKIARVA